MKDLLDQIALVVPSLEGWCPVEKAQWMAQWIVSHKASKIVEIGVFGGRSLIPIGMAVKFLSQNDRSFSSKVVGVDSYDNSDSTEGEMDVANRDWWAGINLKAIHARAQEAIRSLGIAHVVDLWVTNSTLAAEAFADSSLDMVHVDGQHAESVSVRDVNLWWPKLRAGGIMVMDDTDWAQLTAARRLVGSLGLCIHHDEKWEVYEKPLLTGQEICAQDA